MSESDWQQIPPAWLVWLLKESESEPGQPGHWFVVLKSITNWFLTSDLKMQLRSTLGRMKKLFQKLGATQTLARTHARTHIKVFCYDGWMEELMVPITHRGWGPNGLSCGVFTSQMNVLTAVSHIYCVGCVVTTKKQTKKHKGLQCLRESEILEAITAHFSCSTANYNSPHLAKTRQRQKTALFQKVSNQLRLRRTFPKRWRRQHISKGWRLITTTAPPSHLLPTTTKI